MYAFERRRAIQDMLAKSTMIEVRALSEVLGVSEVSVRRDLLFLERQGFLRRVRGGAIVGDSRDGARPFAVKASLHAEEKRRIGSKAAELLAGSNHIILDSGTTVLEVARHLKSPAASTGGKITVITGSLPVIHLLGYRPGFEVYIIGGLLLPEFETVAGAQAASSLRGFNASTTILAADGISIERGITINNPLEADVEREMVRIARETILVADSSKIGRSGFVSVLPLSQIHALVTDSGAPEDFLKQLEEMGIRVYIA